MLKWRDGIWFTLGVVAGLAGLVAWVQWRGRCENWVWTRSVRTAVK